MTRQIAHTLLFLGVVLRCCSASAADTVSFPVDQIPTAFLYKEAANRRADMIIRASDPLYISLKEALTNERSGLRYKDPLAAYADWDFDYAVDSAQLYIYCKGGWVSASIYIDRNHPAYVAYAERYGLFSLMPSSPISTAPNDFSAKEAIRDFSYITPNTALWNDIETVGARYLHSKHDDDVKRGMLKLEKNVQCSDIFPIHE